MPIPGRPEGLGDRGDDGHRAVGGDGQDAVDRVPAADFDDPGHVGEVDDLGDVRLGQPGRLRVPVDPDDPQAEAAGPHDRPPLVPAGADEEDRSRHGGRC